MNWKTWTACFLNQSKMKKIYTWQNNKLVWVAEYELTKYTIVAKKFCTTKAMGKFIDAAAFEKEGKILPLGYGFE